MLIASGYEPSDEPHTITFDRAEPVRLNCDERIYLEFAHRYLIIRPTGSRKEWRVSSAEYAYELRDEQERLIVGWHWHPRGRSPATWPHIHVPRSSEYNLGKLHPPTARVSVEAVIRFAIRELGVRETRPGWEPELDRSERRFVQQRTWH